MPVEQLAPLPPAVGHFLGKPRPLLIDGCWVEGEGGLAEVFDPGTGLPIGRVYTGTVSETDAAVDAARRALRGGAWRRCSPATRARLLWRLAELVDRDGAELAYLESLNEGMPLGLAKILGAAGPAEALRYYAGWCTKIGGETASLSLPDTRPEHALGPAYHAYTLRQPVGIVAAIVPWNAPMVMAVAKLGPALAAGCTVVLKPAAETPLTALWLAALAEEAGFPPGVVNVVPGAGSVVGARLAAHPDVDRLTFTGSTGTGRRIVKAGLANMKRLSLELGGKSPVLVFEDADLERTIPAVAEAIFMNAGQICFAGARLYADRRIASELTDGIVAAARGMCIGHGLAAGTELGPLISASQRIAVQGYVDGARADGVEVLTGGGNPDRDGWFFEPTVLLAKHNSHAVMREEVFGPVLAVLPFDSQEEAIALANDTDYGLAAGIFTRDLSRAHTVAASLDAGSVWINSYGLLDESMPTGGFRQSGWGREAGRVGVEEYTELKSVVAAL